MKRLRKILRTALLLIIALGAAAFTYQGVRRVWPRAHNELMPLTVKVQPQDFAINISAEGELQSVESITMAVPNVPVGNLRIASIVSDGRRVNKGDLLVEFDPAELDLQLLENRSSLAIAEKKIDKSEMTAQVEKSDIERDKLISELELKKIKEFQPKDAQIFTRRQIIEGELDKGFAEKKIVFADARLELKGKIYTLDEAILLLARQQANAKIDQIDKALTSLKLISPSDGIVTYQDRGWYFSGLTAGRSVYANMRLFNLVNPNKMEAVCYVLEKDAGELRPDQPVTVTLDPFPGVEITGKVKSVDKLARPRQGGDSPVKYFQTTITLDKMDANLMRPGIKIKANIKAAQSQAVIVVPRSAIVKKEDGFFAYIEKDPGHFEATAVKLGSGDIIQVVITEGVKPGQVLALNPPDIKQDFTQKNRSVESSADEKKP